MKAILIQALKFVMLPIGILLALIFVALLDLKEPETFRGDEALRFFTEPKNVCIAK